MNQSQEKINYYVAQALQNGTTREECLSTLADSQNSLQPWEYATAQATINTHFQPRLQDPTIAPVQWSDTDMKVFPKVSWVIKGLGIAPGPITELCAFVNTGKTLFAADLGACVANGIPVFGEIEVQSPGKVMHIDFESGETMCKIYYQRILNGHGLKSFHNIGFYQPRWRLDSGDVAEEELTKILDGYKMCIIDCFSAGVPATKQNEEGARAPIDMLNRVSEATGCAIVLLVHEPKQTGDDPLRSVKGSGGIIAAAGSSLHLKRDFGSDICTLTRGKIRLGKPYSTDYRYESVGDYVEEIDNTAGCKFIIVEKEEKNYLREIVTLIQSAPGIMTKAIKHQIEGRTIDITDALSEAHSLDLVSIETKGSSKYYTITQKGEEWLVAQESYK